MHNKKNPGVLSVRKIKKKNDNDGLSVKRIKVHSTFDKCFFAQYAQSNPKCIHYSVWENHKYT